MSTVVPQHLAAQLATLDPGRCDATRTVHAHTVADIRSTVDEACGSRAGHTLIVTCTTHGTDTGRLLCDAHAGAVRVVGGPWASNCGGTVCVDLRALDVAGDVA